MNQEIGKIVVSHRRAVVEESMLEVNRGDVVTGIVKVTSRNCAPRKQPPHLHIRNIGYQALRRFR